MKNTVIILLSYFVVGLVIAHIDIFVLPIYLTVLPFQYFVLKSAQKSKNLPFLILSIVWFLSLGIGSVTFYLNRENAQSSGFGAIGNFDFSYTSFYESYIYLAILQLTLLISCRRTSKITHSLIIVDFLKSEVSRYASQRQSVPYLLVLGLSIIFSLISIWMYTMHIGIIGLHQTQLPFHLTGVLYYSRRFLFSAVLIYLFINTKNKTAAAITIAIYAFIASVTGSSKSISVLLLAPVAFICFVSGYRKTAWIVISVLMITYTFVTEARFFIFDSDASIDMTELISLAYANFSASFNIADFLFEFFNVFCQRLFGMQVVVLASQYHSLTLSNVIDFYTGSEIFSMIPDYIGNLFGMVIPEDKAFGVALGYVGTFTILTNHNMIIALIQSMIIAINIVLQNKYYQTIMKYAENRLYKYITMGVLLYGVMSFLDGNSITMLYFTTIILYVIQRKVDGTSMKLTIKITE